MYGVKVEKVPKWRPKFLNWEKYNKTLQVKSVIDGMSDTSDEIETKSLKTEKSDKKSVKDESPLKKGTWTDEGFGS